MKVSKVLAGRTENYAGFRPNFPPTFLPFSTPTGLNARSSVYFGLTPSSFCLCTVALPPLIRCLHIHPSGGGVLILPVSRSLLLSPYHSNTPAVSSSYFLVGFAPVPETSQPT
ncbi:hypothetical protein ASPFODRAFT_39574 [Aspergillus luchuensis CBS 106.47]|uniref:Uncharacterized protein n=1 Tax=Aspergillus luchuensis (strain CBS 106.47) TaxID=1137211 RepID=A0A1M3TZR0_ASPLC|nr:hypothetical protein ASPFODRAFT_39574 [Aspergillus luchuensis CBS 106.47]